MALYSPGNITGRSSLPARGEAVAPRFPQVWPRYFHGEWNVSGTHCGLFLRLALALLFGVSFAVAGAALRPGQDVFLDVVVSNRFFRPGATAPSLSVRTREQVSLDCLVFDAGHHLLAHKSATGMARQFTLVLDNLPPVPRGVFLFYLAATGPNHESMGIYPRLPGGGEIIQVRESQLDAVKQTISYVLPRAAGVRVRAGFREGLYLQPIISAEPQLAGAHTVNWDGTGQGGIFTNLYQHPAIQVSILARSLPVNVLVGQSAANQAGQDQLTPELKTLPPHLAGINSPPWMNADGQKPPHFLIADDYILNLEAAEDTIRRIVEIKTDCASANRSRLFNQRFELMLFLDTTFLVEDERSQLPFSYRMSTRGLAPGRHVLTANVIDSDSAVGTISKEFIISKP